ncbi:hypothetical protein ACJMK2_012283, partial [Sinanodonta woodiana]
VQFNSEPHNDKEKNSKKTTKSNSTTHNASTQEEHNLDSEPIKPDGNIKIQDRNSEMEQTQPKQRNIKWALETKRKALKTHSPRTNKRRNTNSKK